jgi:hypothetical protein
MATSCGKSDEMALRFVKTSVLTSSDGIEFSTEVALESEEARVARAAAERASARPLFEQLADQRQKKQDEYDANTKLLFAPPKALDEEEFSFLQGIEDVAHQVERRRKNEEEIELERFRAASRKASNIEEDIQGSVFAKNELVRKGPQVKKSADLPTIIRGMKVALILMQYMVI